MRRILMRAQMSPFDNFDVADIVEKNTIGNNLGNLLFPHGIARTLMTEDTEIDTVRFNKRFTSAQIQEINEKYDMLVLPFANAFRISFINELQNVTEVVRKLKIPCVVIGAGFQASLDQELSNKQLASAVQKFVKAVLKKSDSLGLRGERTARYLKRLGFVEERDFTVIGCPSMFTFGKDLPVNDPKTLSKNSRVSMNSKISLPKNYQDFMARSAEAIPDHYYIAQVIEEISMMSAGVPLPKKFAPKPPKQFPADLTHPVYQEDRGRTFTNVVSWLHFLQQMDFSFGSRIHGNIAAILAGIPAYVLVSDQRILELVEYHHIPHSLISDITDKTTIFDLYEKADFSSIYQGHTERFLHYLDFLNRNGVSHIWDNSGDAGHVWFDDRLAQISFQPEVHSFFQVSMEEQIHRMDAAYRRYRGGK